MTSGGSSFRRLFFGALSMLVASGAGCGTSSPNPGGGPAPAGQTGAPPAAGETLPPELIAKVETLIRLTGEYNALAAKVTTTEAFIQHREELSRIDGELQPIVEDISIAEPKLSQTQKLLFHVTYYDNKALPLMQEKSAHYQRLRALAR